MDSQEDKQQEKQDVEKAPTPGYLQSQLLIAMPALGDPSFKQSVTLICQHNDEGCFGLTINRPIQITLDELFEQLDISVKTDATLATRDEQTQMDGLLTAEGSSTADGSLTADGSSTAEGSVSADGSSTAEGSWPINESIKGSLALKGGPVQPEQGFVIHEIDPDNNAAWHKTSWENTLKINDKLAVTASRDILYDIARGRGPRNFLLALGCASWAPGQIEQEMLDNSWLNCPADNRILFEIPFEDRWRSAIETLGFDANLISDEVGHA